MNTDAIFLALLAVVDFAVIVHLRKRHGRRIQMERLMVSLCMAVRRENGVEALPAKPRLLRAS
jgi:hypothetical protein